MDQSSARHMFALRLPKSYLEKAKSLAEQEGISLNHFVELAIAEKIARMKPGDQSLSRKEPTPSGTPPEQKS